MTVPVHCIVTMQDTTYDLYLFGGGPGWFNTSGDPAIGGNPRYTTWIARGKNESGFLQPIGDGVGAMDTCSQVKE